MACSKAVLNSPSPCLFPINFKVVCQIIMYLTHAFAPSIIISTKLTNLVSILKQLITQKVHFYLYFHKSPLSPQRIHTHTQRGKIYIYYIVTLTKFWINGQYNINML